MSFNTTSFIKRRKLAQNSAFALFRIFSYSIVVILFFILGFILIKGFGVINWDFITQAPSDGMTKGGIWPAIVGTFYLMIGSAIFAFPIGIMSGIYMSEYARSGKLVNFIRTMTNNLAGIPSIVFGLFGMAFFVNRLDFGDSPYIGTVGTSHHYSHDRRNIQRHSEPLQRRKPCFRCHKSPDHLECTASDGHSPCHNRIDFVSGTSFGRNSSYPIHLRGLFFTQITHGDF